MLSEKLAAAADENEFFDAVTGFLQGVWRRHIRPQQGIPHPVQRDGGVNFCAINNMDAVMLDDLIGYEIQKKKAG